jgi:hypothetical protein
MWVCFPTKKVLAPKSLVNTKKKTKKIELEINVRIALVKKSFFLTKISDAHRVLLRIITTIILKGQRTSLNGQSKQAIS